MNKLLVLMVLSFVLCSCGKESSSGADNFYYEETNESTFNSLINNSNLRGDRTTTSEVTVFNSDYPFYFWIYDDNKFLYDLPGMAEGTGEWSYESGAMVLRAELSRFDLVVTISKITKNEYIFSFDDRNGPQVYPVEVGNE